MLFFMDQDVDSLTRSHNLIVVRLSGGKGKVHGQSVGINRRLNFTRETATRPSHQLFSIDDDTSAVLMDAPGLEGIVSRRKDLHYRSGWSPHRIKSKNPHAAAVKREAEQDWGR